MPENNCSCRKFMAFIDEVLLTLWDEWNDKNGSIIKPNAKRLSREFLEWLGVLQDPCNRLPLKSCAKVFWAIVNYQPLNKDLNTINAY
ncbi:hypothetical protein L0663_01520 [Dyadobacter sp. CY107]|uniref:hypothetical protein n=1 Tax=Dyadobacter fanqingshengii TaxID=2906443 RepID=UPI001F2CC64C|nr:hypothetical protein [Dyadobacter fanqingshengii]MCF2502043.1 hypothetical protein [Dyadobacter fanqingshengii]